MLHKESVYRSVSYRILAVSSFPIKAGSFLLASAMQSNPAPTMAEFEVFFLDLCFRFIEHK